MKPSKTTKWYPVMLLCVSLLISCGTKNDTDAGSAMARTKEESTAAAISQTDESTAQNPQTADTDNTAADEADTGRNEAVASLADTTDPDTGDDNTDTDALPAPDFTLEDQYGEVHTLSSYKGSVVFLNFWATWCPPCRAEMPDIQKLYEEYRLNGDDSVVFLGIAGPGTVDDQDVDGVKAFLEENGYTYPTVMDTTGSLFNEYYITAYPTTFMIDRNGNVFGYVTGMLDEDTMREIIRQTVEAS